MKTHWILLALTFILASCILAGDATAQAQIPPHPPGTICFTPFFWCWAQPPGPPNTPCGCPSPNGWVQGLLG